MAGSISRRQFAVGVAAAAFGSAFAPLLRGQTSRATDDRPWLFFTRSQGFVHDMIKRKGDAPSIMGSVLAPIVEARGFKLIESKDGRLLDSPEKYAGFIFSCCGDVTKTDVDPSPPATEAGVKAFIAAVENGTPFIGIHSAGDSLRNKGAGPATEYTKMLGGAFVVHGQQQPSSLRVVDPSFPGAGTADDWKISEEWYTYDHTAEDRRVIHLLETAGMKGGMYQKDPFPLTWTRQHGKGKVFYTGLGHREDVVRSAAFGKLIGGALDWCRTA